MLFNRIVPASLALFSILLLGACAPTIGNRVDLEKVKFEVGVTHKNDVADILGLPNAIEKGKGDGLEYWAYNDKPELTGLILPVVSASGTGTFSADTVTIPRFSSGKVRPAALICAFDSNDILVNLQKLQ